MARTATKRKAPAKKTAAKKATTKRTTAKKATAAKKPVRKTAAKKTTAKRTTAKKATAKKPVRKTAAKKTTAKKVVKKVTKKAAPAKSSVAKSYKEPLSKSDVLQTIAENTGMAKKEVAAVMESLAEIISAHIKPRAAGQFTLPGLLKIVVNTKPATKARKGINPFTGEEMMFKAKPARKVVKIRPLKKLKEMADK